MVFVKIDKAAKNKQKNCLGESHEKYQEMSVLFHKKVNKNEIIA